MAEAGGDMGKDLESFLDLWIEAVRERGITSVAELVVDDSVFDRAYVHPTWPRDQLNRRYSAQVSGVVFHLNRLHFYPVPVSGQRPSLGGFEPRTSELRITNNATSNRGRHDSDTVWIARRLGTNDLTFYGNVKHRYRTAVPVTVHDMPSLFGGIFAERLRRLGITVGDVRLSKPIEIPSEGDTIGPVIVTPLTTVVTRCNRDSQNLYAECLLKRMGFAMTGQPGSFLNGAAIVRHVVHERLSNPALSTKLRIVDGSGLSRSDRVAPVMLTAWLNSFHNDEQLGEAFLDSLARGGSSGTLVKRLTPDTVDGAQVQAKSGFINGVSCLSGYVTMPDGRRRCFSIMINDLQAPVRRAKDLQDRIVAAIAADMTAGVAQGKN